LSYVVRFCLPLALLFSGCQHGETIHSIDSYPNHWQPIRFQDKESYRYETFDRDKSRTVVSLQIKQLTADQWQAIWTAEQDGQTVMTKSIDGPSKLLLERSKSKLLSQKPAIPFVSTVLMHWWPKIDYFHWEIGFSRGVLIEMLAGFMIEVIDTCQVAGIDGFRVALKTGATQFAEACLSPDIALPLSVKRYVKGGDQVGYEAILLDHYLSPEQ